MTNVPGKTKRIGQGKFLIFIVLACEQCSKKKVKCDGKTTVTAQGKRPECSACVRNGADCIFPELSKKRGPRAGYFKSLEERLATLENKLRMEDDDDDLFSESDQESPNEQEFEIFQPQKSAFASLNIAHKLAQELTTPCPEFSTKLSLNDVGDMQNVFSLETSEYKIAKLKSLPENDLPRLPKFLSKKIMIALIDSFFEYTIVGVDIMCKKDYINRVDNLNPFLLKPKSLLGLILPCPMLKQQFCAAKRAFSSFPCGWAKVHSLYLRKAAQPNFPLSFLKHPLDAKHGKLPQGKLNLFHGNAWWAGFKLQSKNSA